MREFLTAEAEEIIGVGTDLPTRTSVRAVVLDQVQNCTIVVRRYGVSRGLCRELPGGKMDEIDADEEDCMIREVRQETGLIVVRSRVIYEKNEYRAAEVRRHVGFVALVEGNKPPIDVSGDPDGDLLGGDWAPLTEAPLLLEEPRHSNFANMVNEYGLYDKLR